jgi:uncharacterized protein (TIGR03435 family)
LSDLLFWAFQVAHRDIVDIPGWAESALWDIDATYDDRAEAELPRMLQAMLQDRFRLVYHRENRTQPVYFLEISKEGPKLKESTATTIGSSARPRRIRYTRGTVGEFAERLGSYLERRVVDRTGLQGQFEIDLNFAPTNVTVSASEPESLPSIFQALEEQLGLRLQSGRGPAEVLVIDSVERPSAN